MASHELPAPTRPSFTIVLVYRHRMLRDIVERLLADAGISIVAICCEEGFDISTLEGLRPGVVVVDQTADEAMQQICVGLMSGKELGSVFRLVTLSLVTDTIVVCSRSHASEFGAQQLVESVTTARVSHVSFAA